MAQQSKPETPEGANQDSGLIQPFFEPFETSLAEFDVQPANQEPLNAELPRPEYPRPDFQRDPASWLNLNGRWEFAFDDARQGQRESWHLRRHFEGQITVPFTFQTSLSGIGDPDLHDHLWYGRDFELPPRWADQGKRFVLHFGAVDYFCQVWVNGRLVGAHTGGYVPFSFDITDLLKAHEPNRVVLYVEDSQSKLQPRGKQYWERQSDFVFYTRTSGIWQTVWLEAVPDLYLERLRLHTDIDRQELRFAVAINGRLDADEIYWLQAEASFAGQVCATECFALGSSVAGQFEGRVALPQPRLWSPETPHLYDLRLTLYRADQELDAAASYFGMRKLSRQAGQVMLNNQPYYLRLILDQGYFPGGLLTAPNDTALRHDIELIKEFGFNGARKHQKIEDPRWLYWADRLGLLVWGEMPSAYDWSSALEEPFAAEWRQVMERDFNHPCLMAWVVFNESWGLSQLQHNPDQQAFVRKLTQLTRQFDPSRLVIDNDGWEHAENTTDLLTIHDYTATGLELFERYAAFKQAQRSHDLPLVSDRPILLGAARYGGEPIIFSEFGGMSLIPAQRVLEASLNGAWGYSNTLKSSDLVEQYQDLIEALDQLGFSSGFCYTQLTDVEQEVNGLLTFERQPKVDPAAIAQINRSLGHRD